MKRIPKTDLVSHPVFFHQAAPGQRSASSKLFTHALVCIIMNTFIIRISKWDITQRPNGTFKLVPVKGSNFAPVELTPQENPALFTLINQNNPTEAVGIALGIQLKTIFEAVCQIVEATQLAKWPIKTIRKASFFLNEDEITKRVAEADDLLLSHQTMKKIP